MSGWEHVREHDAWTKRYEFAAVPGFSRTREHWVAVRREGDHWRADLHGMTGFEALTPTRYPTSCAAKADADEIMRVFKRARARGAEIDVQGMVGNDGKIRWREVELLSGLREDGANRAGRRTDEERLFAGVYPTGIVYADRSREEHGDYKRLAFLSFRTLELEWSKGVPADLRRLIESDAAAIQARRGEDFEVSAAGQTVRLGGDVNRAGPESMEVAETIARQLGGGVGRLSATIGAHSFSGGRDSLQFRFRARARNGSNSVRIVLLPSDTYRVEFWSIRGAGAKLKGAFDDVYADSLRGLFENETGLYLSL